MSLAEVREARAAIAAADKVLENASREAIEVELRAIFKDQDVYAVQWAQKSSEYDDEGMYPGVAGPVSFTEAEYEDSRESDWIYDGSTNDLPELRNVLEEIGRDALSGIFGDENIVTARRTAQGVSVSTEHYGY